MSTLCTCRILRSCRFQLNIKKKRSVSCGPLVTSSALNSLVKQRQEYSLLAHSQGSIFQLMARSFRVMLALLLSLRDLSECCEGRCRSGSFIASWEQQSRVQNTPVTLHASTWLMITKRFVHTTWSNLSAAGTERSS